MMKHAVIAGEAKHSVHTCASVSLSCGMHYNIFESTQIASSLSLLAMTWKTVLLQLK